MIRESEHLRDVSQHLCQDTILVLDLDRTLITSDVFYGSETWEVLVYKHLMSEGHPTRKAKKMSEAIWKRAQAKVTVRLIETCASRHIQEWQNQTNVIGLTARDHTVIETTMKQLSSVDISFSTFNTRFQTTKLIREETHSVFHQGIAFCGDAPKNEILFQLILDNDILSLPKKIVMVDDRKHHLEMTRKNCHDYGIEFHGFRYNRCDNEYKNITQQELLATL